MIKLHPFQRQGYKRIRRLGGRALLADEMGLGKTIQAIYYLSRTSSALPAIIVVPACLKYHWEMEAMDHFSLRSNILSGTKTPPNNPLLNNKVPLTIINYDILHAWEDYLKEAQPQTIVLDECHYIKTRSSRRTKVATRLVKNVPRLIALSGTPITNRPAEWFSVLKMLWPQEFPTWHTFAHRYCDPKLQYIKGRRFWDYSGASNIEELHSRVKTLGMIRRLKSDVLTELPDKIRNVVPLDINNRREYNQIRNHYLEWAVQTEGISISAISRAERLTQIGHLLRHAARGKMKGVFRWVDNFLESESGKLVLITRHRRILEMLQERYASTCVTLDGSIPPHKRKSVVTIFNESDRRIFIGNMRAAGVGLNLQIAHTLAFVELSYVPGDMIQAEDRIHRIGQKDAANIVYLVARDTIEETLCRILQEKQKVISQALDGYNADQMKLNVFKLLERSITK